MSILKTFILAFFITGAISVASSQNKHFNNLPEAIQAMKAGKKHLIIFRIDNTKISFIPNYRQQSTGLIDSIIQSSRFRESLKNEYLLYYCDLSNPSSTDKLYLEQHFLEDESPNMIVLNDKEECILYIPLTPGIINADIYDYLHNRRKESEPLVSTMREAEAKMKSNNLNVTELEALISVRYQFRRSSKALWNKLASEKLEIPVSKALMLVTKETFSEEDPFYTYLMNSEHNDLKIGLLQHLKKKANKQAAIEKYLSLKLKCDSIRNLSLYGKSNPPRHTITITPADIKYEEEELMKLVELYTNARNESLLIKTSTMFSRNLVNNTKPQSSRESKPIIIAGPDKNDIFGNLTVTDANGDTVKIKSSADNIIPDEPMSTTDVYALYLAQIAWSFAEVVEQKNHLLEAIVWCKKSIEWRPCKENNHAIAHLYFRTGKPQKAVEHQKKALNLAMEEGLTQKQLQVYKDALKRFESE